jgi:hypothetical protein
MRALVKLSVLTLLIAAFVASVSSASAQTPIILFGYTNQLWSYNPNNLDSTPDWIQPGYVETDWITGQRASLGYEDSAGTLTSLNTAGATINTFIPQPASGSRFTIYFRTHFNLPIAPAGVTLTFSNRIDDGAVFYLNGVEVQRLNIAAGTPVTYQSFATSHEATGLQTFSLIDPPSLVQGDNVLAIEVHQLDAGSSDLVLATALSAAQASPPTINYAASSLTNRTVLQCRNTTMSVSAGGSPSPTYQWFHGASPITDATNASYTITNAQTADAGNYHVTLTNPSGMSNSTPDTVVSVTPDTAPPQALNAAADSGGTQISVFFDEPLDPNSLS